MRDELDRMVAVGVVTNDDFLFVLPPLEVRPSSVLPDPAESREAPPTQESGVVSRGNKGLISLLESRRVFLGAH